LFDWVALVSTHLVVAKRACGLPVEPPCFVYEPVWQGWQGRGFSKNNFYSGFSSEAEVILENIW